MLKFFRYFTVKNWLTVLAATALIVLQVFLELTMPDYTKAITQVITTGVGTMDDILYNGGIMLACAAGSMVAMVVTGFLISRFAAEFSARLRSKIYASVQSFSMAEINRFSTPSLITRVTNDVQQVQMLLTVGLQLLIKAPIMAVWAITKISTKQWQWTFATGVVIFVLVALILVLMALVFPKFRIVQKLTDNLNTVTRENLTGIRVVRAYNAEGYQEEKFHQANKEITDTQMFTSRAMAFMQPVMMFLLNGLTLAIYWIGAYVVNGAPLLEATEIYGDMVVFSSYAMQVVSAFLMLVIVFMFAPRALVSARRINEVLDTESTVKDGVGVGETEERGTVEFRHVTFRYPDAPDSDPVLSDISFKAEQGQTIAFIGATGCGKSSLVQLVPRFFDVTEGEVLVDGHNVKEYTMEELNKKIGYVTQKATLFSGTIKENIEFGDNEDDEEIVKKAVAIAQSTDFVEAQQGAYEGHVAQGGKNFSGGQKQRLSIARAVARNAEIYVFDDSFSALDYRTDKNLRAALKKEMQDATLLIVAQRVGTIQNADQIIVLEDGRTVGIGKHKDLLATCPVYREIAESQLSEEELAR